MVKTVGLWVVWGAAGCCISSMSMQLLVAEGKGGLIQSAIGEEEEAETTNKRRE